MYDFNYAMFLVNQLYGMDPVPEDFEEVGLIAFNSIGNKRTRIYKCALEVNSERQVELPSNCSKILAITYNFEDWNHVSNKYPEGDFFSQFVESYIEGRKAFTSPYYIPGKFVKYEQVGNTLYLDQEYGGLIYIIYKGQILDDNGLPELTEKEAKAIATFYAYSEKYKEGLRTNNPNIIKLAGDLEDKWNRYCDAARVPESVSDNELDQILDAKTSWNRKIYGKSYKPLR